MSTNEIAIIGMSCRFPGGANSYNEFWNLLCKEFDAFSKIPENRWDIRKYYSENAKKPGKAYVNEAAFLNVPIDEFDPLFFGISPREAECIDPQQRFLMEVSWEAIEDAGLQSEYLYGSKTGVFVGGFCLDNLLMQLDQDNRHLIDSHTPTSSTMAIMSNRLSYVFDLKGPSITIDTACSSSLVSTHYACQSILTGESDMAIAAGANIMIGPQYSIAMSKGGFLSKHGRCMTFDERAEGYARGEGVGVVVLKPLQKAIADNDRIHAVISATGVNQDGQTKGMAFPSGKAQEALIQSVYKKAGITANDIDYVEAHGTGTQAGDLTELTSLDNVLSMKGHQRKVQVGSVKTNIGHLEAAAGVAGLIKTTLCLKNNKVVPNLHFKNPNPNIDFDKLSLKVVVDKNKLSDKKDQQAYASINSFGYGGTNAHVVVRSYSSSENNASIKQDGRPTFSSMPVCFSANGPDALKAIAKNYICFLENNTHLDFKDIAYSLNHRRSHLRDRLCCIANSTNELQDILQTYLAEGVAENMSEASVDHGPLVFVYTGMGPQWHSMGAYLYENNAIFKETVTACESIFKEISGWSILDQMFLPENQSQMSDTQIAQPANFIIQVALTKMYEAVGIKPDAVIGHSVGEVASAYISGSLSLEDALLVSYHRSRLQRKLVDKGGMLAVGLSAQDASQLITSVSDKISIAAINSPKTVTLSGDMSALKVLAQQLEQEGIFNRLLAVNIPYHSWVMDEVHDELLSTLSKIEPKQTKLPLYSTVTGDLIDGLELDAAYWWRNVRQPVLFSDTIEQLMTSNYRHFLEIGPHPVLRNSIKESAQINKKTCHNFQSLNHKLADEEKAFLNSISLMHCYGIKVDFNIFNLTGAKYIDLPTYPWQKQSYWRESQNAKQKRLGASKVAWMNENLRLPFPAWEVELSKEFFPYLPDHKVKGKVVFPGAAYVEAGLQLQKSISGCQQCVVEDINFHNMLTNEDEKIQRLQLMFHPKTSSYEFYSASEGDQLSWRLHASAKLLSEDIRHLSKKVNIKELMAACTNKLDVKEEYLYLDRIGLSYGPQFQTIKEWYVGNKKVLTLLELSQDKNERSHEDFIFHPALLDGSFQSMVSLVKQKGESQQRSFVPVNIKRLKLYGDIGKRCWAYVALTKLEQDFIVGDIQFISMNGELIAEVEQIKCQAIGEKQNTLLDQVLYEWTWEKEDFQFDKKQQNTTKNRWVAFVDSQSLESPLVKELLHRLPSIQLVTNKIVGNGDDKNRLEVDINSRDELSKLLSAISPQHILYVGDCLHEDQHLKETEKVLANVWPINCLAQALQLNNQQDVSLTLLSERAQNFSLSSSFNLCASPLEGMLKLITNELKIKTFLIDHESDTEWEHIIDDVLYQGTHTVIAWRANERFCKKLSHIKQKQPQDNLVPLSLSAHNVGVKLAQPGNVDSLYFSEIPLKKPESGEVQIRVCSSALNFKDLLKVYGRIADQVIENTFIGNTLGMEISGVITEVGDNVDHLKVGDEVVAPIPNAFCAYATVPTTYVVPKPGCLSFSEAPIMIGYLAAYRGLVDIADLDKDEKVLIHNATGGVGVAAIQIAKWRGAEIYATAGSDEKRQYLREQGIEHIYDSRSLHFMEEIRRDTEGYGIDVVLNAIAGEALIQSFELLAPYGRFIEIGKRDIADNTGLPMQSFNRNLTFASVDIDRMLVERTKIVQRLLRDIGERFDKGDFLPSPVLSFPAAQISEAFSVMSKSKHLGKITVSFSDHETIDATAMEKEIVSVKSDGAYLVTGGTGGFGLEVGKWLAKKGAGEVFLISRSGVKDKEIQRVISELNSCYKITVLAVDVTNKEALSVAIKKINTSQYPLKGVIHSAMVLDDALIADMTEERYQRVMSPKIDGVMNLHQLTLELKLDFFVSFSSISSMIGNNGQASYVVANNYLDNFSYYRSSQQESASTINWGVLSESGVVVRNKEVGDLLERAGIVGFDNQKALSVLEQVLKDKPIQIGAFDVTWEKWAALNPHLSKSSLFTGLISGDATDGNDELRSALLEQLLPLSQEERQQAIVSRITEQVSKVLKIPASKIDTQISLNNLGIDSLVAAELTVMLQRALATEFSTVDLLAGSSIEQISLLALEKLISEEDEILANLDDLTEEEIDSLLQSEPTEELA